MENEGAVRFETGESFYNPRMEMNRDITVAVLRAWNGYEGDGAATYLDANCASGVRGVRAAVETGYDATLVDRSEDAVELARRNAERNDGTGEVAVERADANVHMRRNGYGYDIVDVDPFGSPVPFAEAAFGAARELVCFTATDTAPLCGAHSSGVRRYGCVPLNTTYHAEMGLRVLVGALVRTAARGDIAATPVLSHSSDHYKRTYLAVEEGAKVADAALDGLGFVSHCSDCGARDVHDAEGGALPDEPTRDCACGEVREVAGPLWTAPVRDAGFVDAVRDELDGSMGTRKRADKMLRQLGDELDTATHYDHHEVCQRFGVTPYKIDETVSALRDAGYEASRTHYSGASFKTDAPHDALGEFVGE